MAIDEARRHELYESARRALGADAGDTLMEMLPPVGWADVATKQDLAHLERRIDLRFDALETRFESRCDALETRFESRFETIESRFDGRLTGIEGRLVGLEGQLAAAVHAEATRMIKWTVGTIFGAIAAVGVAATVIAELVR